jgi:hypothetical protein
MVNTTNVQPKRTTRASKANWTEAFPCWPLAPRLVPYLVLQEAPEAPSPLGPLEDLFSPGVPVFRAGQQTSGGFLQCQGIPRDQEHLRGKERPDEHSELNSFTSLLLKQIL